MGRGNLTHDQDCKRMLDASAGDRQAFAHLYDKYYRAVCDFLASRNGKHTPVADIAQEVFTRVWAGHPRYEARSSVKTFLFSVANNVLREEMRRIRKARALLASRLRLEVTPAITDPQDPGDAAEWHEQIRALRDAMVIMPAERRQAIEMVYIEALPAAEAATLVDCSLEAFRSRLRRAIHQLGELFDNG